MISQVSSWLVVRRVPPLGSALWTPANLPTRRTTFGGVGGPRIILSAIGGWRAGPYPCCVSDPTPPDRQPAAIERLLARFKVDFPRKRRQPSTVRLGLATVVSLAGSLAADALLVAIGTAIFTSTKHYVHFRPSDYGKLTIIGVIIACGAWPIVTWISSVPRWLFFRLAILVTLFLWVPDLYLLYRGQRADAVAILMCMHLAIALVTYNALVHIAPSGRHESWSKSRTMKAW